MALEIVESDDTGPIEIDPEVPSIISMFGKKQSGKSTVNRAIYKSWLGDKICIDVNGDARPGTGESGLDGVEQLHLPLPTRMPERDDNKPRNLYWRADPTSPTYQDDLDRALQLALFPKDRPVMVWAGEIGEFCKGGGRTGPYLRLVLRQNAHYGVTALFDDPRPVNTNRLVIGQADHAGTFRMPDPEDRRYFASVAGIDPKDFEAAHDELIARGPYWWLHYANGTDTLYLHPPLQIPKASNHA